LYFQDAITPVMEGVINLHHDLMFLISLILFFIFVVLVRTLTFFAADSSDAGFGNNVVGVTITISVILLLY
jgi:hypothetical protein